MKKSAIQRNRNEIVQGPSPAVVRAIRKFDAGRFSSLYFDNYYGSSLSPELADYFHVPLKRVSVGYGIEFFMRAIFDSLDPKQDIVLSNAPHYGYYSVYATAKHVRFETFMMIDRRDHFEFDIDGCLSKLQRLQPKILLITSPNNPTGNSIDSRGLAKILAATQKISSLRRPLVVLDEAYLGFDPSYDEKMTMRLLKKYENFVILRGFSKRYALAGLRIGYALWGGPDNGKSARVKIRYDELYLGGSRLLETIAIAALKSEPYYKKLSKTIVAERARFTKQVNQLQHFKAYRSNANFVIVKINKTAITEFKKQEAKLNVAISKFSLPEYVRVSLGYRKDIDQFIAMLRMVDKKIGEKHA